MRHRVGYNAAVLLVVVLSTLAAAAQEDVVLRAMRDELARTLSQLRLEKMDKPYFVAYRVQEIEMARVSATLGSLATSQPVRTRMLGVELRVGDYALDNSNYLSPRNFAGGMSRMFSGIGRVPLDDNYNEVRRQLWLATDAEYKKALEDLSGKRAALQTRQRSEELPDFSKETPGTFHGPRVAAAPDTAALEQLARTVSAAFRQMPDIYVSAVEIDSRHVYTRYLNSEGSSFTRSDPLLKLTIRAETQAANGAPIKDAIEVWGRSLADLPAADELVLRVRDMATRLKRATDAASLERYNGPVLFEKRAAGEIFAQVFAPGLIAQRAPMSDDPRFEMFFDQFSGLMGGGSFLEKIGGRVLPDTVDVVDDPLREQYGGSKLLGASPIDDDAVTARETTLVQKGILKTLLAGRTPVKGIAHSTGSRRGWGPAPSNLIVTSQKGMSDDELRTELLRRVAQRGLDYGIVIRSVGGGGLEALLRAAAMVTRQAAPSNMLVEVWKIFPDGHEEPVRGLQLSDMTAAMFKDVVAVGDKPVVYTSEFTPKIGALFSFGLGAGAEMPPVSVVVPSLLFDEVTLTRTPGPFPSAPFSKPPIGD